MVCGRVNNCACSGDFMLKIAKELNNEIKPIGLDSLNLIASEGK